METIVFLVIAAFVIAIIVGIGMAINDVSKKNSMSEHIRNLPDFNSTKQYMGIDGNAGVAYDETKKKICLIKHKNGEIVHKIFPYKDILFSEILEDGSSIHSTQRGSQIGGALIGGLALGPVGAIIGGLSGKSKVIDKFHKIDLQIVVNDISEPVYQVSFFKGEMEKDGLGRIAYDNIIKLASEWHATISVLIKQADEEDNNSLKNIDNNKYFSTSDEIMKLAKLRDSGIITEIEFKEQKRKLLNY